MPAIKHHEILRNDDYFKGGALPCIVREIRDAPSKAFVGTSRRAVAMLASPTNIAAAANATNRL